MQRTHYMHKPTQRCDKTEAFASRESPAMIWKGEKRGQSDPISSIVTCEYLQSNMSCAKRGGLLTLFGKHLSTDFTSFCGPKSCAGCGAGGYETEEMGSSGDPIWDRTLSSHCSGPLRCISIQHGVLVTSWRWYSAPQPFTKLIRIVHILVSSKTAP